jgi:endoglucanase
VTLGAGLLLAVTSGAFAASATSPDGFSFSSGNLTVDENAGQAVITVQRSGTALPAAQVRYHTPPEASQSAIATADYTPGGGALSFAAGQTTATFDIDVVDHHLPGQPSKTFYVALYGATGSPLGTTTLAVVRIVDTDTGSLTRTASNPLGLTTAPTDGHPLSGVSFFVDKVYGSAAIAARKYPAHATQLDVIAEEPIAMRFVASNTGAHPGLAVERFIERANTAEPSTIPEISTYRLIHKDCSTGYKGPGSGKYADTTGQVKSYEAWVNSVASGISANQVVVYLEIDGLITTTCLGPTGLQRRVQELSYAVNRLSELPRAAVYVDAGADDALSAATDAKLLNEIGVKKIQGFFLGATHYDFTSKEIAYGDKISKLTGGAHFVVNTAVNGRGPLVPKNKVKDGDEVRCNPAGRGLGPKPTTDTGYKNVDAFAWIGNPGLSTGTCGDPKVDPPTGDFFLAYALSLVKNAVFTVR